MPAASCECIYPDEPRSLPLTVRTGNGDLNMQHAFHMTALALCLPAFCHCRRFDRSKVPLCTWSFPGRGRLSVFLSFFFFLSSFLPPPFFLFYLFVMTSME